MIGLLLGRVPWKSQMSRALRYLGSRDHVVRGRPRIRVSTWGGGGGLTTVVASVTTLDEALLT